MDGLALFHGPNAGYALELYERYLQDPQSVDEQTRALFAAHPALLEPVEEVPAAPALPTSSPASAALVNAVRLAHNIRVRGHLAAHINPLGGELRGDPGLDPAGLGLRPSDLAALPAEVVGGPCAQGAANALEATDRLRRVYSGTTGYDYAQVQSAEERAWLYDAIEGGRYRADMSPEQQRALLDQLTRVEALERFLHLTFVGQKRFSIEGVDMLVPMLHQVVQDAAAAGTLDVVMGMAHRGRLNVLTEVLGKTYSQLFAEFREGMMATGGPAQAESINRGWTGDVKYHLGATGAMRDGDEGRITITLASNPSHLEFIDPVIEGMARATQERRDGRGPARQDTARALPLLIHGDAAFPGEGVVAETLNLSGLPGYHVGGTIHIIANNQLGFTTGPGAGRSTLYASDLAKGFEIPIIHVNADDPVACLSAARLAHAYRTRFRKDVLIDLVGYRRWGHNEGDEPAFTQPLLYEKIAKHPTVRALWAGTLEGAGVLAPGAAATLLESAIAALREINRPLSGNAQDDPVEDGLHDEIGAEPRTAVPAERLRAYNEMLLRWPEGFAPHAKLERQLERRRAALDPGGAIDWAHAESLAFAAILADGTPIRLTGQDSERGTFSQRHLVVHDPRTDQSHTALEALTDAWASFAVYNSPLSENAALGFEYGYSVHAPEALVLWEAQYGDFANAAQVIIDQFVVAARAKWRQRSSLVMLLPHGFEGNGPEHSSARLERYLQLAANDNMRIANVTTAAQYFHLLRRQAALLDTVPRPLIVMTPKSLLRDPRAASRLQDLSEGRFQPILDDPDAGERRDEIERLLLCSGKVYVDLLGSDARAAAPSVAIARVEQLYPCPGRALGDLLASYPRLAEVVWVQEEPRNMGAWTYIAPYLRDLLGRDIPLTYVGRPERASPAVGSSRVHAAEQARIVADAFGGYVLRTDKEVRVQAGSNGMPVR